jgi:hypothetical protein
VAAAMTRYSRSVIPGRPSDDHGSDHDTRSLDGIVFGSKKKAITPPANDRENDYTDPMDMDVDEAGFLVDRSTKDRRGNGERRKSAERRKEDGRRRADYAPLREPGMSHRHVESNSRGPILLVAAILIVAVFGVVVWNAYREGVRTDDPDATPALSTAGSFKTPPRETTAPAVQTAQIEPLDGGPSPVVEERPQPAPAVVAPAAVTPAPSQYMAPPPAPLKQPEAVKPAIAAAPTPAAAAPATKIDLPKPTASTPAPVVVAAAPAPAAPAPAAPAAVAPAGAFKPAFAAGGNWLVQVAAPSSEAGAVAEWDRRAKALPEFFATAERFIVHADVNGKSVYRLRAGSFASKADADAFCAAYKAKGGNCFPAAK